EGGRPTAPGEGKEGEDDDDAKDDDEKDEEEAAPSPRRTSPVRRPVWKRGAGGTRKLVGGLTRGLFVV
ncbi:hypothetical protein THAOC_28213, partial [Thalassiosira oceanica]